MLHIIVRVLLTPVAFGSDLLHLFVLMILSIGLCQERGLFISVQQGRRHDHFPTLRCLWKRPWFEN